jgi:TRAP-type C4-dicarboxylate transport system substrate-binding protein
MLRFHAVLTTLAVALASQAMAADWDVSLWGERRASTEHVHKLAELVEDKTDGKFTMNISYGGLSTERENLDGIAIGAFEMAQFCAGYHADKNPSLTVLELPFLGVSTLEEEVAVSHAVYRHPAVAEDLARWNARLLMASPTPQYSLVGTGEPRDGLDKFGGMRVRALGGLGKVLEMAGAVPTNVTAPEARQAMESGVVDAVAFDPDAHLSFGTIELATWWTDNLDAGTVNCPVVVSIDAYEALKPEERAALDGSVEEAMDHYLANYGEVLERWDAILDQKGGERVHFSAADLARLRELAEPIRDRWIADMEARGIAGQELSDLVDTTLEQARE